MGKPEGYVEKYLYKRVKARQGMCLKFSSGIRGVPDRVIILASQTLFVETKALGKKPDALQLVRHGEMRAAGADVRVIDTREQVDELIAELDVSTASLSIPEGPRLSLVGQLGKDEAYVEKYLYKRVKAHHGMCLKFSSGIRGVPDRVVILAGRTLFVETKAPGKKPDPLQIVRHREMRAAGAEVHVIDTRGQIDNLIAKLITTSAAGREALAS